MGLRLIAALCVCVGLLAGVCGVALAGGAETSRVDVSSTGAHADSGSGAPSASADGRFVAFESGASNLVPGDTNGRPDIFVHDRRTGKTRRVSVSSVGGQGNGYSSYPSISANGRFIAFESNSGNLVRGDMGRRHFWQIYVRDRKTGKTKLVSVNSAGVPGKVDSFAPSISADGRFVAFQSQSANLVRGRDTNQTIDIFVHDLKTGKTERASVSSAGAQANEESHAPSISAHGRFVAFESFATNLTPRDTNHQLDVFVHDRKTGKTRRISVSPTGASGNGESSDPSISAGGRFVAFASWARNLVRHDKTHVEDIFVRDRRTDKTRLVSVSSTGAQGHGVSFEPSISADGRVVAFRSAAGNLDPRDTRTADDIYVRDRTTGKTRLESVSSAGVQANDQSREPSISGDGRFIGFESDATNLVAGDDAFHDSEVFLRGPLR